MPDPDAPEPAAAEPDAADDPPEPVPSPVPAGRAGRLVRRWVPEDLRTARWDPGRRGALLLVAVAAAAAVVAALGVWRDRPVPEPVPALAVITESALAPGSGPPTSVPTATPGPAELVVSVVGRVERPGLVRVPDGARVADALDAAGGVLPDTDLTALNLARRLTDGEQLLVGIAPPLGLPVPPDPGAATAAGGAPTAGGPLDLNTATLEQLDALPGVGPVTAQAVLDWRAEHGRFTAVEQLREVPGIGESRFGQIEDLVRV